MTSRRLSTEEVERRLRALEPVRASDDFTERVMDRLAEVERPDPRWFRLARLVFGPQPVRTALAVAGISAVALFLGVLSRDQDGRAPSSETVVASGASDPVDPSAPQRVDANPPVMRVGTPIDRRSTSGGSYSSPALEGRLVAAGSEAAALRHELETLRALIESQRDGRSPILVVPVDDGVDYWVQLDDNALAGARGNVP